MTDDLNTALTTGKKLIEDQLAKLTAEETERFVSLQVHVNSPPPTHTHLVKLSQRVWIGTVDTHS